MQCLLMFHEQSSCVILSKVSGMQGRACQIFGNNAGIGLYMPYHPQETCFPALQTLALLEHTAHCPL